METEQIVFWDEEQRTSGVVAKQIVLIGPDCSGKSTLAQALADYYKPILLMPNERVEDDLTAALKVLNFVNDFVGCNVPFILDHWQYPVDIVYNHTLRGTHSVQEYVGNIIRPYIHNLCFIHVDAEDSTLVDRYNERGDELWDASQILKVAKAYRDYFKHSSWSSHYLNTTKKSKQDVLEEAVSIIEHFYFNRGGHK